MTTNPLRLQHVERFALESGVQLSRIEQAYRLYGELNAARDNLVIVFHALTGDSDAANWWRGVIGPGCAIDPRQHAVLCTNLLGSCYGTRFVGEGQAGGRVAVTTRDMARLVRGVVDELQVSSVALAVGGSLGGMVALEWAASFPGLTRAVVSIAAPAAHTAQAIAWNHVQRQAILLGGAQGLALARMTAMISYRTGAEFEQRFARQTREDGVFQMQSYLDHQAKKLVDRFEAGSYLQLIDAMDSHDVGRGRGGVAAALSAFHGDLTGVGIPGDLLYSEDDVRSWTQASGGRYRQITSQHGHDAFLLEPARVGAIVARSLRHGRDRAGMTALGQFGSSLRPLVMPAAEQSGGVS